MSSASKTAIAGAAVAIGAIAFTVIARWPHSRPPTHLVAVVQPHDARPAIAADAATLRVCADPNNLPFSNERGEGFENALAELVAQDLGRHVAYYWEPQRRGFIRRTLNAGVCDVVMSVPSTYEAVRTTTPYYRSSYMFVSRHDRRLHIRSLDDPRLRRLTIGIQITGDDYENPPAAQALATRHIIDNIRGYTVYGDYSRPNPSAGVLSAVADGSVDVAIAWGPLAGPFAERQRLPLDMTPVSPSADGPSLSFVFDIAMGVRRDDVRLAAALDALIARRRAEIRRLLASYGVPLVPRQAEVTG
jgi:mxaJ protein